MHSALTALTSQYLMLSGGVTSQHVLQVCLSLRSAHLLSTPPLSLSCLSFISFFLFVACRRLSGQVRQRPDHSDGVGLGVLIHRAQSLGGGFLGWAGPGPEPWVQSWVGSDPGCYIYTTRARVGRRQRPFWPEVRGLADIWVTRCYIYILRARA